MQVHVAIGIVVHEGLVLVSRRCKGDRFEDCWEFPGGKLEPGDSADACLHRELMEELGITVDIVRPLPAIEHNYGDLAVRLYPFIAALKAGRPRPLASRELKWVTPGELQQLPFPAANLDLIRALPALLAAVHSQRNS